MGLLQEQPTGLLNKPVPGAFANSTSQGNFNLTPEIPATAFQTPQYSDKPRVPTLTGPTTLSQGKQTLTEKIQSKLPNNFVGNVAKGLVEAPKTIAKEAGFLDEEGIVKLDRLAQSLISKGTDPTRAYDIAGMDLQKGSSNFTQAQGAQQKATDLKITPQEEEALKGARFTNNLMTGLTVSNLVPGVGTVKGSLEKNFAEGAFNIAKSKSTSEITDELLRMGVPKEKVPNLATVLTTVEKPEVVGDLIKGAITEPKAGLLNRPVTSEITPTLNETYSTDKQVIKAFQESQPIKEVGQFELGTFGKNALDRKVAQPDRIPEKELEDTFSNIKTAYRASNDPKNYRYDNIAWVSEMPNGEKRVIYTRQNASGKEEIINAHSISNDKYVEDLSKNGVPERTRTSNLLVRTELPYPLGDKNTLTLPRTEKGASGQRTPEELASGKERLAKRMEEPTARATKAPRTQEQSDELQVLKDTKQQLENMGFLRLQKYESKRGEFKGELNTNTGTGKFAKQYDTTLREVFNDVDNKYTTDELKQRYEDLKRGYKKTVERIKELEGTTLESQIPTRQVETAPEKGATTLTQAERQRSQVPSQFVSEMKSLPDIVERTTTNVKDKVNILDYMRTPDRVLEKIGFGAEAKEVRKGYEAYIKELPKNIEKITEWSKRVPKESNQRIFQYLDGQKIVLDAEEAKVAGEIKDWLKEWATRLKLPVDNQITHYITHIFDNELLNKEFDEDLAKIIADKIPGQVYDPFLEKRLGAQGYKQDTWAALDAYVKRATRKVNLDDALEMIRDKAGSSLELSKLEQSQFKYIQRYVNNVNMRPTELDNLIDNGLKSVFKYKYGNRPVTYLTKLLRQMTFRGMLGANPGSALRNLSQGINTYAKLGEKYTSIGYLKLFNPGAKAELEAEGILSDAFIQDRALSSTKKALEKIDKGLFAMFSTAEHINRGAAYFGAKAKGLAEGMTEEKAIEYAKKMVRDTQFSFGSIDTPVALQNDIVKTLTQFQSYTVKQIEFLTEMAKDKNFVGLLRYAVAGLAFTYTIGKAFDMTPDQLVPSLRFDTPPSLKLPTETIKAILNTPDKYGQPRDLEQKASDIGKSAIGLFPGGTQIKKTVEGADMLQKGGSFDKGGNLQFEAPQTTAGKAQALLFGKYSGEKAQQYFDKPLNNQKDLDEIKPFYDQIQQLKKEGKNQEAIDLYDSLGEKGKEVYKKFKAKDNAEKMKQGKQDILPTFQKIRALKEQGNTDEAIKIYDALTDDEKKYYQALKKQLDQPKDNTLIKSKPSTNQTEFSLATEKDIPTIKDAVYKAFPFTADAKSVIEKAKIGILKPKQEKNSALFDANLAEGEMSPKGADFHNFVIDHIAPISKKASDFILNHTDFLQNLDSANIDIKTTDPTILAHEMLHQVFDNSPMGNNSPTGEEQGTKFLDTWDKVKRQNKNSPLAQIDKHIEEDYKTSDMAGADIATEKFAYLGEMVSKYGIDVIPKDLRPFYKDTFDFPKTEADNVKESIDKVTSQAEHIAPMIDKTYIQALVKQESSEGLDDKNRTKDAGKYGWLVGFTKDTYKHIQDQAKKTDKYKNLESSMPGFDTPEDAMKSALVYSQFLMRDHTKEQQTGNREWKNIPAQELYKLYNGNASPKGVKNFKKHFDSLKNNIN